MFNHAGGVQVHHVHERMTVKQQEAVLEDLASYSERGRIRVVLDCSALSHPNRGTVRLVLSCLELAIKCNGDVRLAAVAPLAEEKLKQMGITQLFESHATIAAAVQSFHKRRYSVVGMADQTVTSVEKLALVA